MRVSLVGTVHSESGQANSVELHAILECMRPEVIFAEIPVADVDRYSSGAHGNLESTAVARYRADHHVNVIPVDLPEPGGRFFDDAEDMFRTVARTSASYHRLMDRHSVELREGGFLFLNSDRCIKLWDDIYREVRATIDWTGNSRLREIYDRWVDMNERRDREMVQNIARCSAQCNLACGVFLVGAAHRKSVIDKALAGRGDGSSRIEWDLGSFLGRAD